MGMVTGIWVAAVVAIITDGAEAVVIIMDGPAAGTADGINCYIEAENQPPPLPASGSESACRIRWRFYPSPMTSIGNLRACAIIGISSVTTEHMWLNRANVRSLKRSSNGNKKAVLGRLSKSWRLRFSGAFFAWLRRGWPNLAPSECGFASDLFEVGLHSSRLKRLDRNLINLKNN